MQMLFVLKNSCYFAYTIKVQATNRTNQTLPEEEL